MRYSADVRGRPPAGGSQSGGWTIQAEYLESYLPVLIAVLAAVALVAAAYTIAFFLAPRQFSRLKRTIYECGMHAMGDAWRQMHIRYYLYAILFVVFAVEAVFILPWTVVVGGIGTFAFVEMLVFMGILFFGLVYAWKKGALEWY